MCNVFNFHFEPSQPFILDMPLMMLKALQHRILDSGTEQREPDLLLFRKNVKADI